MISKLIEGIVGYVASFLTLLLTPVDNALNSIFPNLSTPLGQIGSFVDYITGIISFPLTFLPVTFINIFKTLISIEILYITGSFLFWCLKITFKWLHNILFN